MTVQEVEKEIERVDQTANANTDSRDLLALIARGVWALALQTAITNAKLDQPIVTREEGIRR